MVKKMFAIVVFCSFALLIGCSKQPIDQISENHIKHLEQNLILQISKPEDQNYTVYKKIEDNETVLDILLNVQWENVKVEMSRQPDYKVLTVNIDRTVSYEPVTYAVWLSPNKDIIEVIIEGQSKFGKVTKADVTKILSILETP